MTLERADRALLSAAANQRQCCSQNCTLCPDPPCYLANGTPRWRDMVTFRMPSCLVGNANLGQVLHPDMFPQREACCQGHVSWTVFWHQDSHAQRCWLVANLFSGRIHRRPVYRARPVLLHSGTHCTLLQLASRCVCIACCFQQPVLCKLPAEFDIFSTSSACMPLGILLKLVSLSGPALLALLSSHLAGV
jgi:hypothetical protein